MCQLRLRVKQGEDFMSEPKKSGIVGGFQTLHSPGTALIKVSGIYCLADERLSLVHQRSMMDVPFLIVSNPASAKGG
jgi:hypothetical protein